jgi:membrane protein
LAVVNGLFALIFKVLPDAQVAWSDVRIGSVLTALLFTIGKFAIGLYSARVMSGPPIARQALWSFC